MEDGKAVRGKIGSGGDRCKEKSPPDPSGEYLMLEAFLKSLVSPKRRASCGVGKASIYRRIIEIHL